MIVDQEPGRLARERGELRLLRGQRDDAERRLRVLEGHLALMIMGEPFDRVVLLGAVDYLIDYAGDLHPARERPYDALHTSGVELYHRLDLAIRDASFNRGEVVRLGHAYCAGLRRRIGIAEAAPFPARQ